MTKQQWEAIKQHDTTCDGFFFYAVKGGRTVCRPSCTVRNCTNPQNIVIFDTLTEAVKKGLNPCRKCRPELPDWKGAKQELAEAAKNYIDEHYTEKFSLETIAGELYVNANYLARVFKEITGNTLLWYHNYVRCHIAAELLKKPELNISYICDTVGYINASHFARVFKKFYHTNPMDYRKKYFTDLDI